MKILFDFFPILLFFIAYKLYDIYIATAVVIVATFVQVGLFWSRHKRFEKTHVITLVVVTLFGGATLLLRDPIFIKWKPTIANWLFGVAFLGSQFIGAKPFVQRMMGAALELPDRLWRRLNLSWVAFFVSMGIVNLYVAYNFSESTWVNFKLFGMLGLTLLFVIIQGFVITRYQDPLQDSGNTR